MVNETIAPAEIAGFDVVLDDRDATISDQVGLAAEYRPFPSLRSAPRSRSAGSPARSQRPRTVTDDQKELYGLGYAYWLPFPRLAVTLAAEVDRYRRHWRDTDRGRSASTR